MVRPQWILALIAALAVAAGFAWLGQWQLGVAVQNGAKDSTSSSEQPRPLNELTEPGIAVSDHVGGMVVTGTGVLTRTSTLVVENRTNFGAQGAWVVGEVQVEQGGGSSARLAVALGWAPSVATAQSAAKRIAEQPVAQVFQPVAFEGRYMPPDAPQIPEADRDPQTILSMAPAQLVNRWGAGDEPSYGGYLVLHPKASAELLQGAPLSEYGLERIESVPPLPAETVNWLNVFYAIEWVVFAGFAIFFWYRLARDAWEKEHELKALEAEGGGAAGP